MQLCSGNNYPDCCKHNHLTSAAGAGEGGVVILLVLGQSGSPGGAGGVGWHVFVYDWKMTLGWLAPVTPVAIWDLRCGWDTLRGGPSLPVTFLLPRSEIQDNKQTVVVQCAPVSPHMSHVTHVCYAQSKLANYCNIQDVCPPQPSDLSQVWPHPLSQEQ